MCTELSKHCQTMQAAQLLINIRIWQRQSTAMICHLMEVLLMTNNRQTKSNIAQYIRLSRDGTGF